MKKVEDLDKKPLAPILQKMEVGDTEDYPRSRYRSIGTTTGALSIETRMKFKKTLEGDILKVTRIA